MKQLFTNMDKVFVLSELLLLAEKPSITLNLRKMQIWEEFPETPKEIFKAFRELIFADNNLRSSLTDASTSKLECTYTFYYGSNNQEWIDEFVKKAKIVINDPCIKDMKDVDIELCRIGELIKRKSKEAQDLSDLIKRSGKKVPHDLRHYFVSGSDGRFVLTSMIRNHEKLLLDDSGRTILKVLEEFEQWKNNIVQNKDFEESFIDYYQKISSLIAGGEDIKSI
ncbi:uncharacterized protein LOC121242584 [Juglans microcarpa x Juglans regia]|uniref:uncharacterized protein LOC121242584 n=1 Tax=Juglans microcarpa x Juglans regia TaxID=2249226 RepID=UPI001B7DCC29|nr:uncharacterized protein LOC121242584 [Juglans microcarpa x Juglans regia]